MSSPIKVIITIVIIAVIGLGAGLGVRQIINKKTSYVGSDKFAWGVTLLTFPFPTYVESFVGTQMLEANKLGIGYVRVEYSPATPKAAEVAVAEAKKNGLKVVLVIPFGPKDIFTNKSLEADTTQYVSEIVSRFKGKVAVYQLATEVASVALANQASKHGIELVDYPPDRLNAVTTWVMAATKAVKKVDPKAKSLVNDQWVHTGFFDNYFAKGGDFDLLGWNWFSDMGTSMDNVTIDAKNNQNYALLNKLNSYKKPIWLTEVNRRLGSQNNGEKAQAEFITTMAKYAKTKNTIKGFFVYSFLEDQTAPPQESGYSLVTAQSNSKNEQKITGFKPAFESYKQAIKNQP